MSKVRIERANVVLHVEDYEVQRYLTMGYNVTDENGRILQEAVPTNLGQLQLFWVNGNKRIKELEAEITELKAPKKVEKEEKEATSVKKTTRKSKE